LVLAALTKESGFALGAAFVIAMEPAWWAVALPGLAVLALLRLACKSAPPDRDSLARPLSHAFDKKRAVWFDYGRVLSGSKATPWLAAAVLPGSALCLPALVAMGLAALQTFVAADHARLLAMGGLFLIPAVAVAVPEWLLWPWALASTFWPFRAEWV
jgi:hypothetical protein